MSHAAVETIQPPTCNHCGSRLCVVCHERAPATNRGQRCRKCIAAWRRPWTKREDQLIRLVYRRAHVRGVSHELARILRRTRAAVITRVTALGIARTKKSGTTPQGFCEICEEGTGNRPYLDIRANGTVAILCAEHARRMLQGGVR